uniref:Reverse transcriptase domain-containing protein n=1 Tax=Tanacetum cinerariifolium TaxID=118510 RepID=A0A6L2K340_TANCI|nr:reverse transcriptase domain-containing protein [Tanacetum cinerariifolium]
MPSSSSKPPQPPRHHHNTTYAISSSSPPSSPRTTTNPQPPPKGALGLTTTPQGIDIAGPFSNGPVKIKFLIVAIDYFTKWIEAKSMATITEAQVHRTMIKSSNGEKPFSLMYGAEAVIPVEIDMRTLRTMEVYMIKNDEALGVNLDLLEEKREQTAIQEARSKVKMEKYYNAKVRITSFRLGDLVYQNNEASYAKDGGKLKPKWEGPYEVMEALGKGAYKLRDYNRNTLP